MPNPTPSAYIAAFAAFAASINGVWLACPSVRVVTLDGRGAAARETAWASADVFCSLGASIVESAGGSARPQWPGDHRTSSVQL